MKRVLLIENDEVFLAALNDLQTSEQLKIRKAENGFVGFRLIDEWKPDVVLLVLRA